MPHPDRVLSGYLHHHATGARAVVPLVERRAATEDWAARMVPELHDELDVVEMLRARVGGRGGVTQRVVGTLATAGATVALRLEELVRPGLDDLLELEAIRLGVEGKRRLWLVCRDGRDDPRFAGIDPTDLLAQAERQAGDVERARRRAAAAAVGVPAPRDEED